MAKNEKVKPKKPTTKELEALCKRVQADFENYKKRNQREREEFSKYANTDLILQIVPIMDNFRLATKHLPEELAGNNWVQGVLQIEKQLEQVLKDEGVSEIETAGQFDPYYHDALEEVFSDKNEGEIVEVITKGYKLNEKVIRHAKVKVSKGEKNE